MPTRLKSLVFASLAGLLMFSGTGNAIVPEANSAPPGPTVQEILATPIRPAVTPPSLPAAPVVTSPQQPASEKDPCEASKVSYNTYVLCQDRIKKIQRMLDAQKEREDAENPTPPTAPVVPAPATPTTSAAAPVATPAAVPPK